MAAEEDEGTSVRSLRPWRARVLGWFLLAAIGVTVVWVSARAVSWVLAPRPPTIGEQAPNFAGRTITGSDFELSTLRGQVVVLDFFATWCSGCVAFWPAADRIERDHRDRGLTWVGVHLAPAEPAVVRRFLAERGSEIRVVIDDAGAAELYGVYSTPTYVVIDREGRVRAVRHAMASEAELRIAIDALLDDT